MPLFFSARVSCERLLHLSRDLFIDFAEASDLCRRSNLRWKPTLLLAGDRQAGDVRVSELYGALSGVSSASLLAVCGRHL